MAGFVLDASVAISWCFPSDPTENTPYSRGILKRLTVDDAIVPEIWAYEIANSIFVSCNRRKRVTERQVGEYLNLLKALPIRVEARSLWANVDLESLARRSKSYGLRCCVSSGELAHNGLAPRPVRSCRRSERTSPSPLPTAA